MAESPARPRWTVSIVSHGHGAGVARALADLHRALGERPHRFVLTFNAGEDASFVDTLPQTLRRVLRIIANASPKGFAANHNAALRDAESEYVLMADPDLSLPMPIFDALEARLRDPHCGIVAPLAQTPDGRLEDNGRALVTPAALLRRYLRGRHRDALPASARGVLPVDWVAGLFMAMRTETFHALNGFDERYFLYCEDVDLCLRARRLGLSVELLCDLRIAHAPNRNTLKKLQHFLWHVQSLLRLWRSPAYRERQRL